MEHAIKTELAQSLHRIAVLEEERDWLVQARGAQDARHLALMRKLHEARQEIAALDRWIPVVEQQCFKLLRFEAQAIRELRQAFGQHPPEQAELAEKILGFLDRRHAALEAALVQRLLPSRSVPALLADFLSDGGGKLRHLRRRRQGFEEKAVGIQAHLAAADSGAGRASSLPARTAAELAGRQAAVEAELEEVERALRALEADVLRYRGGDWDALDGAGMVGDMLGSKTAMAWRGARMRAAAPCASAGGVRARQPDRRGAAGGAVGTAQDRGAGRWGDRGRAWRLSARAYRDGFEAASSGRGHAGARQAALLHGRAGAGGLGASLKGTRAPLSRCWPG
ncbi:MAG: hypothetical protein MO847_00695 [Candidatus Protistobacter heckmanni]|nr:hypothetical protein [Candidatus Protistobacter heckmanni]